MSVPASLSSIEDAIRLAEVALGPDDLVAIVDGSAKLVMPISGPVAPHGVLRIDALMLDAVGDLDDTRLVLATRRRGGPPIVLESELDLWRQLRAEHDGRALQLCDWLVFVEDGAVLSLAELAGPAAQWS